MGTVVMVREFDLRKTRKDDTYAAMRLNLGSGGAFAEIDARMWGMDDRLQRDKRIPTPGELIEVDYKTDEYQGRRQWIVSNYTVLDAAAAERHLPSFTPPARIDEAFYRDRLEQLIEHVRPDRACGIVLRGIYDRAGLREAFYRAPAAYRHHQNYPGGLLEHVVNVTQLALSLATAYAAPGRPGLTFNARVLPIDWEVLVAAGLLHDIGKLETYVLRPMAELTDVNRWEGHLSRGYAWVRSECEPLLADPPYDSAVDELHKLLHCILAHHGSLEFGSPMVPACAEAFLLAQADMTDARMAEMAEAGYEALGLDRETRWLSRQQHFPGGVFIGDWPRE